MGEDRNSRSTAPAWTVPLADIAVDDEIAAAADAAIRSGWWSMGPRVAELERAFAEFTGSRHAVAVTNGTAALHLALLAAECGPGDEVVLPSLNFVAAANAIRHCGATPVFCDIEGPHDLNHDPDDLEQAVGPRTKALLVLHYGGYPCDLDAAQELASERGLVLIEDAAHAPGATWRGRACGTIGQIGCFSFFSNKNLPTGEGGMVVTDDDALADRLRLMRSHGMTTLTWDRHRGHADSYDVLTHGYNYRLDEVRAAVGLVELQRLPDANDRRARIAALYRERLEADDSVVVPFAEPPEHATSSHHLAVVVLPEDASRDAVRDTMRRRGIQTSVHYPPIHLFSAYAEGDLRQLPQTEALAERILTLPLFAHMTDDQVDAVVDALFAGLTSSPRGGLTR